MSEQYISKLVVFIIGGGFVAIVVAALIFNLAFKVNRQIRYLQQIYEQVASINNTLYRANIQSLDSDKSK